MMNTTDEFISFIMKLKQASFSDDVIQKSKECILDYIGCAYAGSKVNEDKFNKTEYSSGKCDIFGLEIKTNSLTAAFINGFNAHTVELDDGNRFGMIHLGSSIISALYAVYQEKNIPFESIVRANIIGYEVGVRVSLAMQPGHKNKGFHTSGTAGTIAAAVAVAVALNCNETQLKSVISAAATSAAGLLEIQSNASELKPYNIGHAAMSGLNAAYIGMLGFDAPQDILNGPRGMLKLLSNTQCIEALYQEKPFYEIERIYVKPYAACRHCHSAIEAAILLKNKYNIPIDNIENIEIKTYALAIKGHNHTEIEGISSAKLSIPFSVALAYVYGNAGLKEYNQQTVNDEALLSLTKKVIVTENEEFSNNAKSKRIAEVIIKTKDNQQFSERVDYAKGDPENPLSYDELINKFRSLMEWSGYNNIADKIIRDIFNNKEI